MTTSPADAYPSDSAFVPAEGIDFELDYRGLIDGEEAWEWTSCGPTFDDNYSSDDAFTSQAAAVQDAVTFLTSVYTNPADFSDLEATATCIDIEPVRNQPLPKRRSLRVMPLPRQRRRALARPMPGTERAVAVVE